jgi:flavin reductase (DIM6/NTAB) family NADH-FMN oxidoreductase RutF
MDGEKLRSVMRTWPTGVSVVTSENNGIRYGMTVNSFTSVSLTPPIVVVTLSNQTRTHALVQESGSFGISILAHDQVFIADRFSGRHPDILDRFAGLELIFLLSLIPFIKGALAFLECRVNRGIKLPESTLFLGEVQDARLGESGSPLLYFNRKYHRMDV